MTDSQAIDITELWWYEILVKIVILLSSVSLASCIFIICLYTCRSQMRTFVSQLMLYLAISEGFNSLTKIFSMYKLLAFDTCKEGLLDDENYICIAQKITGTYSDYCTHIITVVIAYTLYDIMKRMNKDIVNKITCFRLLIFGIPFVPALSLVFLDSSLCKKRPRIQIWCWINRCWEISMSIYITYWCFIISNIVISLRTISYLRKQINSNNIYQRLNTSQSSANENNNGHDCGALTQANQVKIIKVIHKLYYYPIVSVLIWVVSTLYRIVEAYFVAMHQEDQIGIECKYVLIGLYSLQCVITSCRGLIYSSVYFGTYEKCRRELSFLVLQIRHCCFICTRKERKDSIIQEEYMK